MSAVIVCARLKDEKQQMTTTQFLACVSIACSVGFADAGAVSRNAQARQALVEVRTVRIPDSLEPLGVVASADGQIALWTRNEMFIVSRDGHLTPIVGTNIENAIAGAYAQGAWELVDVGRRAIIRFGSLPSEPNVIPFVVPGDVHSAARMSCGWLFQLWNTRREQGSLVLVDENGSLSWSMSIWWARKLPRSVGLVLHLVGAGDEATATALGPPFETAVVNCAGHVEMLDQGPRMAAEHGWIALGTVPIATGFLTTYSDITSNRRVVRWRDSRGAFVRDAMLNVPLGLAASIDSSHVVAIRRTDYLELVVYAVQTSAEP